VETFVHLILYFFLPLLCALWLHRSYYDCAGVRNGLRNDCTMCDAVKAAIAARENEINNVDPI
jgi:hypothetical protein